MARESSILRDFKRALRGWIAQGFKDAGHELTGALARDIVLVSNRYGDRLEIEGYIKEYGMYLERGVPAARIPFTLGSGRGRSLYIQGLMNYVRKRMQISSVREQKSVAFAIAYTQKYKRQGMPKGTGGKGTAWLDRALKAHDGDITRFVNLWAIREMDTIFTNFWRRQQAKFNAN